MNYTKDVTKNKNDNKKGPNKQKNHHILNLSKGKKAGLDSLIKRVKAGELMVVPTDKSGGLSVLSLEQYLDSGHRHTNKDQQVDWSTVRYLKNQVNSHMS